MIEETRSWHGFRNAAQPITLAFFHGGRHYSRSLKTGQETGRSKVNINHIAIGGNLLFRHRHSGDLILRVSLIEQLLRSPEQQLVTIETTLLVRDLGLCRGVTIV